MSSRFYSHWLDHVFGHILRRYFHNPRRILKPFIRPGMTALDVGFGNGYFSLEMARMVGQSGRVVSVETDAEEFEPLRQKVVADGLNDRIDIRICDNSNLAVDDLSAQFDFALARYVVHHAADIPALMSGVRTALKPGGMFLIVEPCHHASASYCKSVESMAQQAGLTVLDYPKITRTWALLLGKD